MIKLILVDVPQETSPDCKAYVHLFDRNENGWFMLDEVETELRDLPNKIEKEIEVEIKGKKYLISNWDFIRGWNACLEEITGETECTQ